MSSMSGRFGRALRAAMIGVSALSVPTALTVPAAAAGTSVPTGVTTGVATASPHDAFYRYTGAKPLRSIAVGTVLKTRTVDYHVEGVSLPLETEQLLYRTENALGRPAVNVTTVIRPLVQAGSDPTVVSYQSFYDSLSPADEPSVAIAGGQSLGGAVTNVETVLFAPMLLAGATIVITDTEGQGADFAAGPEYGTVTLDALRAVSRSTVTGVGSSSPIGLIGYSGGAIASEWAAEQAPTYAPGIAKRIVGTAIGGVLVEPAHNLHYVEGSTVWAGVAPMALIGIARSYHIDLTPYLSAYGKRVMARMDQAPIAEVLGAYPGLTWKQLAKPAYPTPESVPVYVRVANRLIMGTAGTPSAPMFIGQGSGGELEGTSGGKAGIGAGDGVMIAGDVRTLAREYCARGVTVKYQSYPLSHFTSAVTWLPQATAWLEARFAGVTAPSSCGSIPAGNGLEPISVQR
ncbi:MAG: lipase family protein [Nocardioides sp.]|uniref:lipase family protein n=1 Tax=Nocardioides sp. TaxID=35761 RepID=UPI0039E52AC7